MAHLFSWLVFLIKKFLLFLLFYYSFPSDVFLENNHTYFQCSKQKSFDFSFQVSFSLIDPGLCFASLSVVSPLLQNCVQCFRKAIVLSYLQGSRLFFYNAPASLQPFQLSYSGSLSGYSLPSSRLFLLLSFSPSRMFPSLSGLTAPSSLPPLGFLKLIIFFPAMPGLLLFPLALCFPCLSPSLHLRLSHWICSASPLFPSPTSSWPRSLFQYKCSSFLSTFAPPMWFLVIPSCCGTARGCWKHRAGSWGWFLHLGTTGGSCERGVLPSCSQPSVNTLEHPSTCGSGEWQWNPWRS